MLTRSPRDHPVFSRVYGALATLGEHSELGERRAQVLAPARGRLLIVGLGPGHDLDHLPAAVTSVVGLEPSATMRHLAASRVAAARTRGLEVDLVDGVAEALPLPDASVDTVLFCLVLCSVDSIADALAEARRVVRPDGAVLVLEHVAAEPGTWTARAQAAAAPWWGCVGGGCSPVRRTREAFETAGFDTSDLSDTRLGGVPVVAPHLVGVALPC